MMKWDSNSILYYFTNDSPLFPDIQKTLKTATEAYNSSFLSAIATTQFDINANIKTLSEQESIDNEVYKTYLMSFGLSVLPTFVRVISNGVINGKLSYNHVYNFLLQYSWYGQKFPKMKMRINSKNDIDYNWLSLLAPALHNFLTQIETSILLKSYTRFSNWILCIDSLTLKFEGALRDFIRLTGTSTSKIKDEETREMLLEDLLNSSAAKELFTENDLALFKFVFTKKGDNIRNNVAHCFYHSDDYSFDKICRIFICILRLGKYRLKPSNDKNE